MRHASNSTAEPKPKPRSEWTTLTKVSYGKLNNPMMVNGSAVFGIDVRLPNMVYAAIRQVPVHGGRLRSVDADRVAEHARRPGGGHR